MPHATSRLQLPYPDIDDGPADVPLWLQQLAAALDNVTPFGMGLLSARPASSPSTPGIQGRWYFATDTPTVVYFDIGTGWQAIGSSTQWILSGNGAPSNTLGSDGQFYIDIATGRFYGPKASGAWPAAVWRMMPLQPTYDQLRAG
jgi:hypothetical protein